MKIDILTNTKYGRFIINKDDQYVGQSLLNYGEYCQHEVDFLSQIISEESIVCDIGANIGSLTIPFAKFAKKVYAFEPHPKLYNILCGNIAINNLDNVEAYKVGIGEQDGVMGYQDIENFALNNGAHSLVEASDPEMVVHITSTVPACNVMKVDVEGMELEVLKGATEMIKACSPFIFVENDRKEKSDALISYLSDVLEYKCYWFISPLFNPSNFYGNPDNIWGGDVACFNMICYPKSVELDMSQFGLKEAPVGSWWKDES